MSNIIETGESILRPRARIIKTIGEELISNDIVAVIELVKNSYDADASIITIKFDGIVEEVKEGKLITKVLRKEGASISIYDDGIGMSLDTIKTAWLEPATISKKDKVLTKKTRRYTGEKGIGRFASAKLSSLLEIITKQHNDNEIKVDFKWEDFSDNTKYLDEVKCKWEVRSPQVIKESGTLLKLINLNSDWDENKLNNLEIALSKLLNPIYPVPDFLIELILPKGFALGGTITTPDAMDKPNYKISGSVDSSGKANMTFYSKKKNQHIEFKDHQLKLIKPLRVPQCGPFGFEFRVWDRDSGSIKELAREMGAKPSNITKDLNDLAGISIYRDNFRVLPYGEKKNDWLRLDIRRVNNPTLRLSNNQVVGYVSIHLENNPLLTDQSNREGIIESQAFTDLEELIILILNELEQKRYDERPRENEQKSDEASLFSKFSITPLVESINKKLPNDKELIELASKTQASITDGIIKVQEVISRYRRLSTLGVLIDVILHDGRNFLLRLDGDISLLEKEFKKKDFNREEILANIFNIKEEKNILAQLFKRLEPFGGRKRGRPKNLILEQCIKNAFGLFTSDFGKLGISAVLPQSVTEVQIDEGELQMILVNLIQNAMYWLEVEGDVQKEIAVEVYRDKSELNILFSDSGPGIKEGDVEKIFDPYYSTRPDGVGLGLTVIGEIMGEYDGDFALVNNGPLPGATFKLTFRRRI